jgi:hypothetical protein
MLVALVVSVLLACIFSVGVGSLALRSSFVRGCDSVTQLAIVVALSAGGSSGLSFLLFMVGAPRPGYSVLAANVLALLASHRNVRVLLGQGEVRESFAVVGLVGLIYAAMTALIKVPGGGGWRGDWREHWERAVVFTKRLPATTELFGNYLIPARPPLANSFTAAAMDFAGTGYVVHQATAFVLSMTAIFAILSLRRVWQRNGAPLSALQILVLVASAGLFIHHEYAWTKAISATPLLVAASVVLIAHRGNVNPPAWLVGLLSAIGAMVHYSAAPFVVGLMVWMVCNQKGSAQQTAFADDSGSGITSGLTSGLASGTGADSVANPVTSPVARTAVRKRRPFSFGYVFSLAVFSGLPVLPWIWWVSDNLGFDTLLSSTSSVEQRTTSGVVSFFAAALLNLAISILPINVLRIFSFGTLSDGVTILFMLRAATLILSSGIVAGWVGVRMMNRTIKGKARMQSIRYGLFVGMLATSTLPEIDVNGGAHVVFVPVIFALLAYSMVAVETLGQKWKKIVAVSCVIDVLMTAAHIVSVNTVVPANNELGRLYQFDGMSSLPIGFDAAVPKVIAFASLLLALMFGCRIAMRTVRQPRHR